MEGGKAISWHLRGAWEAGVPASSSLLGFEIQALAQALGTYSAAFVNGLWFSAGLFVGSLIVQSLGRVSLQPHGLQHTRPPCPSLSPSLLKLMSVEMPSNHLIFCCPLLLPSIFPSIRVFSNESALYIRWPQYWGFSLSISPSSEY